MKVLTTFALVMGFVVAVGIGAVVGPKLAHHSDGSTATPTTTAASTASNPAPSPPAPATSASHATAAKPAAPRVARIDATRPDVEARLKPLLNRGANMKIAAEGFQNAEQFAAVAHAARNTDVPFMLLKHRVLIEGKTLTQAIHESRPANAAREAARARREARTDMTALAS